MTFGNSTVLDQQSGQLTPNIAAKAVSVSLKSALTGSLTISGIRNTDGTAAAWVIASGTSGHVDAPGSGASGGGRSLWFTYSDPTDAGKAIAAYLPV